MAKLKKLILDTYTTTTQLYNGFYTKGYVNHMFLQSTTLFEFITRKETPILYQQTKYLTPVMCHQR